MHVFHEAQCAECAWWTRHANGCPADTAASGSLQRHISSVRLPARPDHSTPHVSHPLLAAHPLWIIRHLRQGRVQHAADGSTHARVTGQGWQLHCIHSAAAGRRRWQWRRVERRRSMTAWAVLVAVLLPFFYPTPRVITWECCQLHCSCVCCVQEAHEKSQGLSICMVLWWACISSILQSSRVGRLLGLILSFHVVARARFSVTD